MRRPISPSLVLACVALAVTGCNTTEDSIELPADASVGGPDVAIDVAGPDGSIDAGPEASTDAGADGSIDAGPEASTDAGADAALDAALDVAPDASPDDASEDVEDASSSADATIDSAWDVVVDVPSWDAPADVAGDASSAPVFQVPPEQLDLVGPSDGAIGPDGSTDGTFQAVLVGPLTGLMLVTTDAVGNPVGGQQWDTIVGADTIPAGALGVPYATGYQTWELGVYEQGVPLNGADGSLELGPGTYQVTMAASDSGWFVSGQHFRLFTRAPDGTWSASPVTVWP